MKKDRTGQSPEGGFGRSLPSKVVSCVASAALATMMVPAVAVTAFADEVQQGVQQQDAAENIVSQGIIPSADGESESETVHYKLVDDGTGKYTLTFWDPTGDGVIPDYVAPAENTPQWQNYEIQPWRKDTGINKSYQSNITKVVFEKSITVLGELCVANLNNCTDYYVMNKNATSSSRPLYFYNTDYMQHDVTIHRYSTAAANHLFGGGVTKEQQEVFNRDRIRIDYLDARDFESTYATNVFSVQNPTSADVNTALDAFKKLPAAVRKQLNTDIVPNTSKTYMAVLNELAANNNLETVDTLELKQSGHVDGAASSVQYKITDDGSGNYTLTFWDSDPNGEGVIPDYVSVQSAAGDGKICYDKLPWRIGANVQHVTKVVFEESIKHLGEICVANMPKVTDYYILNDKPTLGSEHRPIYFNLDSDAPSSGVTIHRASTVTDCWSYGSDAKSKNTANRIRTSWLEAEDFESKYESSVFKTTSVEASTVQAALAEFKTLPGKVRKQLDSDSVPGTSETYMAALNRLAAANDIKDRVDAFEVVKQGQVPSSKGNSESIMYKVVDEGDGYTLTFWDSDPSGDGKMPDYTAYSPYNGQWDEWGKTPWRVEGIDPAKIAKVVFDKSITHLGNLCAANLMNCTDYYVMNDQATSSQRPIYFMNNTYLHRQITIHHHSTMALEEGKGYTFGGEGNLAPTVEQKAFVTHSYLEAENFEADNASIWAIDSASGEAVQAQKNVITVAYDSYKNLPDKVRAQLASDKITGSEDTYATRLTKLMAALNRGGTVDGVSWTLTQDANKDTFTLDLSGSGTVTSALATTLNANAAKISSVNVGSGVTGIGSGALSNLTELQSIDISQTVTTIADGALPSSHFTMYGWLNHASGKYAEAHNNIQLKLKELRILCMGNSHTVDYTEFLGNVIKDQSSYTKITFERLVSGGRGLYTASGERSSHYRIAHDIDTAGENQTTKDAYDTAFAKTWDIVIMQDYQESTKSISGFSSNMQTVVKWLRNGDDKSAGAKGAKLIWFADWAPNYSGNSYENSIGSINAVNALTSDKPDYIIPASTILANASTSYLGSAKNRADVIYGNKNADGTYNFGDCFKDKMDTTESVLWRDDTHMSLELGRQMMATGVLRHLYNYIGNMMQDDGFDYDNQKTDPVFTTANGTAYWQGEMNEDLRQVIKEAIENSITTPLAETKSTNTTDPFAAKYESLKNLLNKVTMPDELNANTLKGAFTSDDVLQKINAIGFSNTITADDVAVSYTAPEESADDTGKLEVKVNCHYGYTFPAESDLVLAKNIEIDTCTVNFNGNGATSGEMTPQTVNKNSSAAMLNANKFSRAGYTFTGWNTAANGTGTAYVDKNEIKLSANTTLYAQWVANTYTVKFDANGGSGTMADQKLTYDATAVALSKNVFTRSGYRFAGWKKQGDHTGQVITDGSKVKNLTAEADGVVALVAQWEYIGSSSRPSNPTPAPIPMPAAPSIGDVVTSGEGAAAASFKVTAVAEASGMGGELEYAGPASAAGTTSSVAVPESVSINGVTYVVTSIAPSAFKDNASLASVNIPATVVRIGASAFESCTALTSVKIPAGVKTIEPRTFKGCTALKSVTTSATRIDASAFAGCTKLAKVKAPKVKVIGKKAFKGDKKLKSLTTGTALTTIGASAFAGSKALTSITVTSKHLSKAGVKGSLAGSAVKNVIVRVGAVKANKAYAKKYAKLFTKKIAGKKATVTASNKPLKK